MNYQFFLNFLQFSDLQGMRPLCAVMLLRQVTQAGSQVLQQAGIQNLLHGSVVQYHQDHMMLLLDLAIELARHAISVRSHAAEEAS